MHWSSVEQKISHIVSIMCSSRSNGIGCDIQFTGDLFDQNFLELLRNRDVINGKVGKAAALPKFFDTLTNGVIRGEL